MTAIFGVISYAALAMAATKRECAQSALLVQNHFPVSTFETARSPDEMPARGRPLALLLSRPLHRPLQPAFWISSFVSVPCGRAPRRVRFPW